MDPKNKTRKIGTQKKPEKKPLIDPRYKSMIYTIIVLVIIALFFIINNTRKEPEQGPYPPDYKHTSELISPSGTKLNLADYKGKVVLLDFWATWCAPCRKGIPDLIELKKQFKGQDFEIVGISVDDEKTKDQVVPFIKQMGINYPVAYYDAAILSNFGNIESIPTAFIIDKSGKVISSYVGLTDKSVYIDQIKKLLGQS